MRVGHYIYVAIQFSMNTQFVKKILFKAIQFSQTVLIQFRTSTEVIY